MVKTLSRDAIQRMTGRRSSSAVNIGGGSGDGSGVSRAWVEENYISKAFFETLFTIHGTKTEGGVTTDVVITPNDTETTLSNIQAMVGLWTNSYLSALGLNPGGGGGGGATALTELVDVNISNPQNGQALIYNSTAGKWINGESISDIATIRSNAAHGQTAYEWGNHATAGYAKVSETMVLVNHGMSTIDADTIKTAGSHRLSNSGTNFPAGPDWGQMLVVHGGGDTYAQMYFPYTESAVYIRNGNPDASTGTWREWKRILTAGDAVTSVAMSVPTGFSISGSPITSAGTLALSFASGYSLPTTAKQTQWDNKQDAISDIATIRSNAAHGQTAYEWGNHANAGYATQTWVQQGYLPLTGGTMTNTSLVTNLNADMLDGRHGDGYAVIGVMGTRIEQETDLNDILNAGTYTCISGADALTLSNTPYTGGNFRLWHIINTGTDGDASGQWSSQIMLAPNEARMFIRSHNTSSFGEWKEFAWLTSNVASATKLQTARTIWGQSFDGTADVSGAITGATTISASGNVSVGGTLGVTGATTLSSTLGVAGLLTANGGISIPSGKTLTIGDAVLSWDSTNQGIKITKGLYSETFISALGANSSGGGGGATALSELVDVTISNPQNGQTLVYNSTTGKWINGQAAAGSVTSVAMSVPTGFTVSGSPITSAGTLALSFASGYSLPTTAKQTQWDNKQDAISDIATIRSNAAHGQTAYEWGNHATAGYAKVSETMVLVNHGMSTIDADTIKTAGSHRLSNSGTNFPAGPDWGQMLVVHGGGDTYAQMYFPHTESAVYIRNGNPDASTGTWREWKRILTAGDAVTSVAMSVPTGFSISGSPITSAGTLAISFASGYSLPTTAKQTQWDNKQDAISDLATIRSNASHGETAYDWGNHATAGYATQQWVQQGYVTIETAQTVSGNKTFSGTITPTGGIVPRTTGSVNTHNAADNSKLVIKRASKADDGTPNNGLVFEWGNDNWVGQLYFSDNGTTGLYWGGWTYPGNVPTRNDWVKLAFVTDNVASATKLKTPRTIWGQSFDGTGNVSGDITDAGKIFAKGDYLLLSSGKSKYGLMVESTSWGENRDCAFGFHAATSGHDIAWSTRSGQNDICLDLVIDPNNTVAKRYTRVYDALCIGDAMIVWDSVNNALKVIKMNGDAANFYATGGVSALGSST